MTIYNFNLGIGWASSGVEYAQAYRSQVFRNIDLDAKFVFMEMIKSENIIHLTRNIGFKDEEIIWLYQYFSDIKLRETTYTIKDVLNEWNQKVIKEERSSKSAKFFFEGDSYVVMYLTRENEDFVDRAEFVIKGNLIRKDYYSYVRVFSEFYSPKDNACYLYLRRFYNEDGSTAYDEIIDGKNSVFKFKDKILYSYEQFCEHFVKSLNTTENDVIIIDRATQIGQPILRNRGKSKVLTVVHADHYSADRVDENTILWNNYYEYEFSHANHIDAFISSTDAQSKLLAKQFEKYTSFSPKTVTVPVGSIKELKIPTEKRKSYSLITASRLAKEKHIELIIPAVARAKQEIPELTLDIYGTGGESELLEKLIDEYNASDYICLKGHQNLEEVYKNYECYISASMSEGFGLTLLEAVGSGLAMIGFNVPYGNPTFIKNNHNGVLIKKGEDETNEELINMLTDSIKRLFNSNLTDMHEYSYKIASKYLSKKVENKWEKVIKEVLND